MSNLPTVSFPKTALGIAVFSKAKRELEPGWRSRGQAQKLKKRGALIRGESFSAPLHCTVPPMGKRGIDFTRLRLRSDRPLREEHGRRSVLPPEGAVRKLRARFTPGFVDPNIEV